MQTIQTITTKRLPCTATKPERIVATTTSGIRLVSDYSENGDVEVESCHAAFSLAVKLGWNGRWIGGTNKDGGFVFVCADSGPVFVLGDTPDVARRPRTCF